MLRTIFIFSHWAVYIDMQRETDLQRYSLSHRVQLENNKALPFLDFIDDVSSLTRTISAYQKSKYSCEW